MNEPLLTDGPVPFRRELPLTLEALELILSSPLWDEVPSAVGRRADP